jgi:carbonic anhydrase
LEHHGEHQRGYQPKVRWTEVNKDMQSGSDRYYASIVNRAIQAEQDAEERVRKLDEFHKQPKRGTLRVEEDVIVEKKNLRKNTIVSNSVSASRLRDVSIFTSF